MKMLINASRAQQLRVAVVEGTTLHEYQVQIDESGLTRGNIYRGVVANVQPSLNAAFIDIGEERHGFLPVADVLESSYQQQPSKKSRRPNIDQVLKKGQPILVQVTKDGAGQKGAALTTNIALAGRYLVLTPFDAVRGISRKAEDDKDRKAIKGRLKKLSLPDDHGVIVRTNGIDQNQATLSRDLNALLRLWRKVQSESTRNKGPRLLYSDQDLVVQALRDYLDPEIEQVVVDSDEVHAKAEDYMKAFMPRSKTKLVRYRDSLPLFSRYRLEAQIDKIYERTAALPSGGSIVIDLTEALTAIDVNSGRATRNSNHEESIFKINCEAAEEVARQLRLRDIGGLVVVDFIDMRLRKHQARLERIMRDAMKPDKARYSVGRVSPNGLLEINRQRIKQSLRLRTHRPCPTCNGQASIPTPDFAALRLLSRVEGRAASGRVKHVTVALHPEMADVLQNHFRRELMGLESDHDVEVEIIAASSLQRTEERLEWVERSDEEAKALGRAQKKEPVFSSTDLSAESRRRSPRTRTKDDEARTSKRQKPMQSKSKPDELREDSADAQKKTSSRRRRSRRKKDGEQPAKEQPQQVKAADSSRAKSDDDGGGDTTPRRRRSRGGRGRRGGRGAAEDATSQERKASTQAKDDGVDTGTADDRPSTTRRRRSRSRSRADDEAGSDAGQKSTGRQSTRAPVESKDDDNQKVVRQRRRSRRTDSGGSAESPQNVDRSKSDGDGGEKKKRTRTRSSNRRPSIRTDGAKSDRDTNAKRARDTQSTRAEQGSDPGGETTRRRRSRSRSRASEVEPVEATSAAPKPRAKRGGRRATAATAESRVSANDNDSKGEGGPRSKAAEKPSAPVGVLAGQGVEPKPKSKRRWAWWGGPANPAPDPNEGSGDS